MTGGYLCVMLTTSAGMSFWLAVPLTAGLMFGLGVLVERIVLRRMIGQPIIMVLMLTLGLEILLRGMVPGLMGSGVRRLDLGISQSPIFIGEMLINRGYLVGGAVALVLISGAIVFFNSRLGVTMRAVSDDQIASWSVGIRVERVIGVAWGMAGISAAMSGILWGSVQGVDWTLSLLLLKALAIAILGGLDSVPGVLVAGIIIGVCEGLASGYLDDIVGGGSREVLSSVIILATVLIRPHGLFGREHIERV